MTSGLRIEIRGTVQGVGFRPWVFRIAHELGVAGRVRNHARGVTVEAFGDGAVLDRLVAQLGEPPPPARVRELVDRRRPAIVSARFHDTLIAATADRVRAAIAAHGRVPIVLTGGAFANPRLAQGLVRALSGLDVRLHGDVPPATEASRWARRSSPTRSRGGEGELLSAPACRR